MALERLVEDRDTPERVIKTLLLTDLVDSTALVGQLGDDRAVQVFQQHDRVARDLLLRHNGLEIDKSDGFLFVFDRPIDAMLYALAFHEALRKLSRAFDVELKARAGIHLGEVALRRIKSEYVARGAKPIELEGLAKPMAARLMSLAQGGQTLMTRAAFELAKRATVGHEETPKNIRWVDHGDYKFKGIADLRRVYEVGCEGLAPLTAPPNSLKARRASSSTGERDLEWRPAVGLTIPDMPSWKLERKLGEGRLGEVWLASSLDKSAQGDDTVDADASFIPTRDRKAFLFKLSADRMGGGPGWLLQDPMACVLIASGDQKGAFALVAGPVLTGGRSASMDLQIDDPKVSRTHFEIRHSHDGFSIQGVRAKNGVLLNGVEIGCERKLRDEDKIEVGDTQLVFYAAPEFRMNAPSHGDANNTRGEINA